MTPAVAYSAIAFVWMFGNLFELLAWHQLLKVDNTNLTCVLNLDFVVSAEHTAVRLITIILESILPMTSLAVCYGIILYKIRKQRRVMCQKNVAYVTKQGINNH